MGGGGGGVGGVGDEIVTWAQALGALMLFVVSYARIRYADVGDSGDVSVIVGLTTVPIDDQLVLLHDAARSTR